MACANPIVHVHNECRLELLSAFTKPAMQEAETRNSERLTRQSGAHRHLQVALLLLVSNRIANPEIATVSHSQRILRALELCSRDQVENVIWLCQAIYILCTWTTRIV